MAARHVAVRRPRGSHQRYQPAGEPARSFTNRSGSVGLLFRPAGGQRSLTVAVSLARAARIPALEELFYFGAHPGNFAFEVGNPELRSGARARLRRVAALARAAGVGRGHLLPQRHQRLHLRAAADRGGVRGARGGVRGALSRTRDQSRGARTRRGEREFPTSSSTSAPTACCRASRRTATSRSSSSDRRRGRRSTTCAATLSADRRAAAAHSAAARCAAGCAISATRSRPAARWWARRDQERVFAHETPTDGYGLLKLFASYSFAVGRRGAHHHGAARQRDQRALSQPPVAHQGPGAGDGAEFQAALQREVLEQCSRRRPMHPSACKIERARSVGSGASSAAAAA